MLGKLAFVLALVFNVVLIAQNNSNTDLAGAEQRIRIRSLPSALVAAAQQPADDADVVRAVQPSVDAF